MNSRRNATLPLGLEQQERAVWQRRALGADRARLLLTNPLEGRENDVLKPRFDATSDVAVNDMALERIRYQAAGNFSYQAQNYADVEGYLLPLGRVRDSALHSWGVASGLRVTATAGSAGVKVSTGSALDAAGRVIVLADGGRAVVDQDVADRTVKVSADGLTLDTGGLTLPGDQVLTLTWQEVMGIFDAMGGSQQQGWLLAPWLRLLPLSGFEDTGQQVVLAQLTFGSGGKVKTLSPGLRRAVGVPVERLEFRHPSGSNSATLKVEDAPAADLRARADGGLDVNVPSADGTGAPALSVEGGTGTLKVQSGLQIEGGSWDKHGLRLTSSSSGNGSGLRLESSASDARSYVTYAGSDGRWHFADRNADRDRLLIDATGNVAIGSASPRCALHVEGTEVHSGGASGGFSFADRTASSGAFVESPTAGERWRWYAQGGQARLWSGTDQISVGKGGDGDALDVPRRMRVRQGNDSSAGIWFRQASANTDRAFVGMETDSTVGLYGNGGAGWGMVMDTASGNVRLGKAAAFTAQRALHVEGTEVHSGGASGGFSFADRSASSGAFVENPTGGERWRWYAQGGQARLWSGTDQISVGKGGDGDALDVPRRMRVRQGGDPSAGIWFRQASVNTDRAFVGMETDSTVGLYGNGGAGWGMVMDTASGNVRLGKAAAFTAQRALHVEGTEVHSGGASGGFSFADRSASSGAFVENPTGGERWRWYAQGGQARLWSGTDQISVGKGGNGDALDVPRRMRVRQGGDPSAGIWFRQASVNTDRAFVGMESDSTVGLYGTGGAGWGLVMDTVTGNVRLGKALSLSPRCALHVEGTEVHSGGASGGFSFADRTASSGAFVESPTAGERWRWYAQGGQARLWSGTDQISVGKGGDGDALDVPRRMRVRQGNDSSAGIWFRQASANTDRAFVGMETDSTVGLYGTGGAGWGMVMNTVNGKVGMGTTNPQNGRLDVRVGQGGTAVAAVGKVDVEGYPGYPSIDVRGQIEIEARSGYAGLTIEQKQAYNAADIHGTLQVTGYEGYSAIYVDGNVRVIGTITGRAQMVTIDHPEDPANRYLSHTAVTSPEMTTFYNGTIVTDDQGEATVELPGYFEKLNGDRRQDGEFRYQLTPVGCLAVAIVVDEIEDNRFTIRTDKPNVKVSWQVTGIRQDAWANANRMAAELDKPEGERGLRRSAEAPAQPKGDATPQEPESNISSPGTER